MVKCFRAHLIDQSPWASGGLQFFLPLAILVNMVVRAGEKVVKTEIPLSAKMWDDFKRPYSDAIVEAKGGYTMRVHRNVLASKSALFKKQFEDLEKNGQEAKLVFTEEPNVVECVVRHCYNGFGPDSDAVSVLPVAYRYGMDELVQMCGTSVITTLNASNAAGAVQALRVVKDEPQMKKIWEDVERKIRNDGEILNALMNKVELAAH